MSFPYDTHIERVDAPRARLTLLDGMRVERGTKEDWDELHALHYKAEGMALGPSYWRCVTPDNELAGVTVFCYSDLLCAPRHVLFPNLKPTGNETTFTNTQRAHWLNKNFRRAARIVTDTLYRGIGVGYRMVNLAMRLEGVRFIEIMSSMSKFNPFDVKAGFVHAPLRPSAAYEPGLKWFRKYFASHPADHEAILKELATLPEKTQQRVLKEMREFYYRHSSKAKTGGNLRAGTERVDNLPAPVLLKELQQLVFATPVYGVWENPDLGRELPNSLPLSAFDRQGPREPLKL